MTRLLLLAGLIIAVPLAARAADANCRAPEDFLEVDGKLKQVARAIQAAKPLKIVVVGGPSSTGKANSTPAMAFPARLAEELRRRYPQVTVEVSVESQTGVVAWRRIETITRRVLPAMPTLVIWQTGTADAIHSSDVDQYSAALSEGIEALQAAGVDVVLMDPQYSPVTAALINFTPYRTQIDQVAMTRHVVVFHRHELMRFWVEQGLFSFGEAAKDRMRAEADAAHICIGRLLADLIAAKLP